MICQTLLIIGVSRSRCSCSDATGCFCFRFPPSSLIVQGCCSSILVVSISLAPLLPPARQGENKSQHGFDVTTGTGEKLGPASIGCQVLAALQMRAEAADLEEWRADLHAQLKELVQRTLGGSPVENLHYCAFARALFL